MLKESWPVHYTAQHPADVDIIGRVFRERPFLCAIIYLAGKGNGSFSTWTERHMNAMGSQLEIWGYPTRLGRGNIGPNDFSIGKLIGKIACLLSVIYRID